MIVLATVSPVRSDWSNETEPVVWNLEQIINIFIYIFS